MSTDEAADMSRALMLARAGERVGGPNALVRVELDRLRARHEAQRTFRREQEGAYEPLDVCGGIALAERAHEAPRWRVEGLMPADGLTLISAQRKTGKTTFTLNLARSVLTGQPFLDMFNVTPLTGAVAVLNFEVSAPTFGRWAAEAGVPLDRLVVANLAGRRNPLLHDEDRAELGRILREWGTELLIVDPFANAFTGDSQNDAGQVAAFYRQLREFAQQDVGAADVVLVNHAGWDATRSRGSSALEDAPDSIIRLTADQYGTRYLSAMGRDVDEPEGRLEFDAENRRLTLDRSANKVMAEHTARLNELIEAVAEVVAAVPGLGTRELQAELTGRGVKFKKEHVQPAIATAVALGQIEQRIENRGKKALYPPSSAPQNPVSPERGTVPGGLSPVPPSIDGGRWTLLGDTETRGTVNEAVQP